MSGERCSEAEEGVHEDCCLHDLPDNAKHAPGQVCCWCGDIFLPHYDERDEHGEYKPKTAEKTSKKARKH